MEQAVEQTVELTAEQIDVAIVGAGPAGLQAALVLARTRKRVVVFDSPDPPRNAASHGVHNFVGLDGMLPSEISKVAWGQIDAYHSARRVREGVEAIEADRESGDGFIVVTADGRFRTPHIVLACGLKDLPPAVSGFAECWGDTIIPCPFCDGYENRDRRWGIVATDVRELEVFPAMVQNWTGRRLVIAPTELEVTPDHEAMLAALDVPLHRGDIVSVDHIDGKVRAVTLDHGEVVEVETLLWTPPATPVPLVTDLTDSLGLALDEHGQVIVDETQRTNVPGLWAAGDVQGWMGAIESAGRGGMAAAMIVHDWYAPVAA